MIYVISFKVNLNIEVIKEKTVCETIIRPHIVPSIRMEGGIDVMMAEGGMYLVGDIGST